MLWVLKQSSVRRLLLRDGSARMAAQLQDNRSSRLPRSSSVSRCKYVNVTVAGFPACVQQLAQAACDTSKFFVPASHAATHSWQHSRLKTGAAADSYSSSVTRFVFRLEKRRLCPLHKAFMFQTVKLHPAAASLWTADGNDIISFAAYLISHGDYGSSSSACHGVPGKACPRHWGYSS